MNFAPVNGPAPLAGDVKGCLQPLSFVADLPVLE